MDPGCDASRVTLYWFERRMRSVSRGAAGLTKARAPLHRPGPTLSPRSFLSRALEDHLQEGSLCPTEAGDVILEYDRERFLELSVRPRDFGVPPKIVARERVLLSPLARGLHQMCVMCPGSRRAFAKEHLVGQPSLVLRDVHVAKGAHR